MYNICGCNVPYNISFIDNKIKYDYHALYENLNMSLPLKTIEDYIIINGKTLHRKGGTKVIRKNISKTIRNNKKSKNKPTIKSNKLKNKKINRKAN